MLFDAERVCLGSLTVISEQASSFLMAQIGEWLEEGKGAFWKCGCLGLPVPEEGKASWGTGEQHPQHPALDSGTTRTLSQGVWEHWCWHPGPRAWAKAQLSPTAEQGLSSAQQGVVCSEACPKYLGNIKKEAIKAPSSWLPACWLTAALSAAGGELCSAAKPCWGHGALCHPP